MIAPAVGVAAATADVLAMPTVVSADCVATTLMQMTLIAVTPDIVELDGARTRSAFNVNAIAETRTHSYWW